MNTFVVEITSTACFETEIEAENEREAREKAMQAWLECDQSEIEFYDTNITYIG